MEIAKVTSKGQITVPKEVREKLNLETGSKVVFLEIGDEMVVRNAGIQTAGIAGTSEEIKERILAEAAAKYNLDLEQIKQESQGKSTGELFDEVRRAFAGVAEEAKWETEQDVANYVKATRLEPAE